MNTKQNLHTIDVGTVTGSYVGNMIHGHNGALIMSARENWTVFVNCLEKDGKTNRGMDLIRIQLPIGKTFSGTIQDIRTILAICQNGANFMTEAIKSGFENINSQEAEALRDELAHIANLFT